MAYPKHIWDQIKNLTAAELAKALERDGWKKDTKGGSAIIYRKESSPPKRVSIHFHPKKTFGAKQLQALFGDTGWDEQDLKRLKLVK